MGRNNERELINKQTNPKGMMGPWEVYPYYSTIRSARDNKLETDTHLALF